MGTGSSLPYRLRPNKAVDRELFMALLVRLGPSLGIENYRYVSLGGPFLEDFRLAHARLGLTKMVCLDSDENVHKRQTFNKPVACIKCLYSTLEEYLDETDFVEPVVIWFDYTDPNELVAQIERFSRTVGTVPVGSVLRITLNANPGSLGKYEPRKHGPIATSPADASDPALATKEWRLEKLKQKLAGYFPSKLTAEGMSQENYGPSLLHALRLAVDKVLLGYRERRIDWALCTHYADGQAMTTATLVVSNAEDESVENILRRWEFRSRPENPLKLDLPSLSTIERIVLESKSDARELMGYDLPESNMGEDPFVSFRKYYRLYPHFSRVEI